MKILITGAHLTPALAVIKELIKDYQAEIVYVGRNTTFEGDKTVSVESQVIPKTGAKFIPIIAGRLHRNLSIYTFLSLLKIPIGFLQGLYIILQENPQVILSFGGYISVPLVVWGWLWSIPVIIHEQTLVSGIANKINALFADKLCISFKEHSFFNQKNCFFTGNPLRDEILHPTNKLSPEYVDFFQESKKNKRPIVLITGGNQGSHIINLTVESCLPELLKIANVIHQTGDSKHRDFDRLNQVKNPHYLVQKWIDTEIGAVMLNCDLVIARAGINTLLELAYLAKLTLVIPLPHVSQNEQTKNAVFFEKQGLVKVLLQSELTPSKFLDVVSSLLKTLPKWKMNPDVVKSFIVPDAAKRIALETILLGREK